MRPIRLLALALPFALVLGRPGPAASLGNSPPATPSAPSGPVACTISWPYSYYGFSSDPDGQPISLDFSWGDGSVTYNVIDWDSTDAYGVHASHTWSSSGTFQVRVRAGDGFGVTPWSAPLAVTVTNPGGKGSGATQHVKDGSAP